MANNNNKDKCNVPHLRFPEFSGEWEMSSIGEQFELYSGNTPSRMNKNQFDGSINWITSGELKEHYISDTKEKISEEAAKNNSLKLLPVGTFVIAIYGLEANGVRGTCSITTRESTISQACMAFTSKMDIQNEFLYSWYKKHGNIIGIKYAQGTKQQNLSYDIIERFNISYPCMEEQKKLIRFISLIDQRIATQNKIIEDLKKLKSAISKQVFAQEPNGWCRLDTLFSKGKAGGTPTSTNKEYYNGEIPFLSINDITKQGKYVRYTENHLSQSGLENSSAWVVPKYSLIMSMYASVGLVTINEIPTTTSQAMFAMQLKDKGLLDYLYYYLSYFKYRYIHKYLETGTQSNINADIIRGIMIPIYGHSRNMEIASTLQGIDVKIDNELSVLKLFNKQKNYLLSQMFI
ncbi:restriction endonuclease subunit S [Bacteroides ovatus]|uniref:restriction endonuclease subunit S n=1 Tax=Bacteroides ovatus TaxID=28116 RepID=UPI000896DD56|nr:restriction endonuclease subunit S [Bacteroides ovatus]UBN58316.1 restriction endonuclease subunit S [Bacteroides ovatus]SDY56077.1 type I restriction enzyme, S subunit [Bacteroides ovatus]